MLEIDMMAPDFKLPASNGQTIELLEIAARQPVVLYFYPKADTPGCTKQACGFRDSSDAFQKAGVIVLGVSPDPIERVKKFADKFKLNFPLLADADHAVCERYGMWQKKSLFGHKYWGALRSTFVISKGGRIAHIFHKVRPKGHEREVLKILDRIF
jgi:peroxiredoxin Q/BCP